MSIALLIYGLTVVWKLVVLAWMTVVAFGIAVLVWLLAVTSLSSNSAEQQEAHRVMRKYAIPPVFMALLVILLVPSKQDSLLIASAGLGAVAVENIAPEVKPIISKSIEWINLELSKAVEEAKK